MEKGRGKRLQKMRMYAKGVMVTLIVMKKKFKNLGLGVMRRDAGGGTIIGVGVSWTCQIQN